MEKRRIDQILANFGYCSRSRAARLLRQVEVLDAGGGRILDPAAKYDPETILVDGRKIEAPAGLLVLMHKPTGHVCSHDAAEGPRVYDLLPEQWMRRNPQPAAVGRLDKDTSGLLLITDRHELIHRLTSPKRQIEKVYEATCDRPLEPGIVPAFAAGITLRGEHRPCLPARCEITGEHTARVTLVEGMYHQVRRMFADRGWQVTALHRSSFGGLELGELAAGAYRLLDFACLEPLLPGLGTGTSGCNKPVRHP